MKLNIAKKACPVKGNVFFYVTSETHPDETYIVLETQNFGGRNYFCQCKDFFVRHLPLAKTAQFSNCKHIKLVQNFLETSKSNKYEVWTKIREYGFSTSFKSHDLNQNGLYKSRAAAERAIRKFRDGEYSKDYEVRVVNE
jgi:hypothetical protein